MCHPCHIAAVMPIFVSQISGIQSSIDKLDSKMEEEIKSIEGGSARSQPQETNKSIKSNQASPESNLVPKLSDLTIGTSPQLGGSGKKDSKVERETMEEEKWMSGAEGRGVLLHYFRRLTTTETSSTNQ